jgi:hypothetical protein
MDMSSRHSSNTVGATKKPLPRAPVGHPLPPITARAPSARPARDVAEHLVHVLLRHQRSDLRLRIHGIADAHRAHPLDQALEKCRLDGGVHEHARGVRAHLPRGVEIAEQRARHRIVQLGIVEHDQRRLAAELERDVFNVCAASLITALPVPTSPVSETLRISG